MHLSACKLWQTLCGCHIDFLLSADICMCVYVTAKRMVNIMAFLALFSRWHQWAILNRLTELGYLINHLWQWQWSWQWQCLMMYREIGAQTPPCNTHTCIHADFDTCMVYWNSAEHISACACLRVSVWACMHSGPSVSDSLEWSFTKGQKQSSLHTGITL